ncbi:MAG: hypothetical protein E7544_09160 [Ruminococcaceae bacterium]|nr:hypothetical protein [Oscillospiraceae bacterium]
MNDKLDLIKYEAYDKSINIGLFNEFVAFIASSSKEITSYFYNEMRKRCIWYSTVSNSITNKYGFRYPGEMLERYETRFGSDIKDIRALALALAYTQSVHEENMFVDRQKANFIRKVKSVSDGDLYLKTAIYMLDGKRIEELEALCASEYNATEEVIFLLSLFDDAQIGYMALKDKLVSALFENRSISAVHNAGIFAWFLLQFESEIRAERKKDYAVLRTLLALMDKFVDPDSKAYDALTALGYDAEEIAYLNYIIVDVLFYSDKISTTGVVSEKIAVEFCKRFLLSKKTHSDNTYELMRCAVRSHEVFNVKCYDERKINDVLIKLVAITNPITFARMYGCVYIGLGRNFDALEEKWDILAKEMSPESYDFFFSEMMLKQDDKEVICKWLEKYKALTGKDYMQHFKEYDYKHKDRFSFLALKGIISLTDVFNEMLALEDDDIKKAYSRYIDETVTGIHTREAFLFFRDFFSRFNVSDMKELLGIEGMCHRFFRESGIYYSGRGPEVSLLLERDFLSVDEHKELLGWIDDMFYYEAPEIYEKYVLSLLKNDFAYSNFSKDELSDIYRAYCLIDDNAANNDFFISRFLTESEINDIEAKRDAEKRAKREEEEKRLWEEAQEEFEKSRTTWAGLSSAADRYYYRDHYLYDIIRDNLDKLADSVPINSKTEAAKFFLFCKCVLSKNIADLKSVFELVEKVKERMNYEEYNKSNSDD